MKIEQLSKKIQKKRVLEHIDFTVERGKVTGVIGRNGAGKTTLLRLMVGILRPTSGNVLIEGKSIYTYPELKQNIVFVPDSSEALKSYTIREIERLYHDIYPRFDRGLFYELLERFNLPLQARIGAMSKGMKALFSLILAFATKAQYILLDEPTDGLDVIAKKRMLQFIVEAVSDYDVAVVISSHRLDELEYLADSIIMIKEGKMTESYTLDSLKESYKKVQVVFPKGLPDTVKKMGTLLGQTGKVYILILEGDVEQVSADLKAFHPLYYEELPLTLEDLFVAKLGGDEFVG